MTVYFIRAVESRRVKIGYTAGDPAHRMGLLQVGSPEQLELAAVMPGDRALEHSLHHHFAAHVARGEWFNDHGPIGAFIDELNFDRDLNEAIAIHRSTVDELCPFSNGERWALSFALGGWVPMFGIRSTPNTYFVSLVARGLGNVVGDLGHREFILNDAGRCAAQRCS